MAVRWVGGQTRSRPSGLFHAPGASPMEGSVTVLNVAAILRHRLGNPF